MTEISVRLPSTKFCKTGSAPKESSGQEITVVAHCLLDPITRVKGLRPLSFQAKGPTLQLPCPEALYLGLERWAVTRNQLDVPEHRRFCLSLINHYVDLLEMMAREGARVRIVGVAGSPSCGVETTSSGYAGGRVEACEHEDVPGQGVFMEELMAELERRSITFEAEEVGGKGMNESEFGCMPEPEPFGREEMDRFE